jgi:hypothetical protein
MPAHARNESGQEVEQQADASEAEQQSPAGRCIPRVVLREKGEMIQVDLPDSSFAERASSAAATAL